MLHLLKEMGILGSEACDTPLKPGLKLSEDHEGKPVDRGRYQRLGAKLIYLSHLLLDIAIAMSMVSQFMHALRVTHLEAVMRILK